MLTITGSGFAFAASRVTIMAGSQPCTSPSVLSDTTLTCVVKATTERFLAPVAVTGYVTGVGNVLSSASFSFLHYWSRAATWAGAGVPVDGAAVVVPANMTVMLDGPSAALKSLVLEGNLMFDPAAPVVQLMAGSVLLRGEGPLAGALLLLSLLLQLQ
jgi:hypothetical protein